MSEVFIIISSFLAAIAPLLYVYDILKKGARPHRTTRFVVLIITAIVVASLYTQNSSVVWLALISFISCLIIFTLSIKYGAGGWAKLDILCLIIALVGLVIWKITDNAELALYASIFADFTGYYPTLVKTFKYPKTESLGFFGINLLACTFSILALKNFSFQNVVYPLYLVIINLVMIVFMVRGKSQKQINA